MSLRAFVAIGGGVLAAVGLALLAIFSVSATDKYTNPYSGIERDETWECGTAFAPVEASKQLSENEKACSEAIGTRSAWGWTLTGAGLFVLLGAAVIRPQSRRVDQPAAGGVDKAGQPDSH